MDPESVTPSLPAELYLSLFEQAADAVFVADSKGRVVAVNPRASELLGFAAEEMMGRQFTDFADPDDLRENPARMDELRAGWSVVTERPLRCKDGRLIPCELTTRILPDGHLLGVARDLTERKRAEEGLGIAHARLEALWGVSSLSEASPKVVADHILDSIVRMTRSVYGFYGYINDDESVMTIHAWSGEAMQDCSLADKPLDFAISEAGVWGEAVRRRSPLILNDYAGPHEAKKGLPQGHVPLTRLLVVPFFSNGRITAVAAAANRSTDYTQEDVVQLTSFLNSVETIAERARAEEARQVSEALLKATQSLSGVGGWEWDVRRQTMMWTEETYRIHDLAPGEIALGSPEHIEKSAACYAPGDRAAILEAFRRCAEEGTPYDMEVPFTSTTGRALWVRTRAEAVRRGDRVVKVVGNIMDITERRQAEELLRTEIDRFRTLARVSDTGAWEWHRARGYLWCSPEYFSMLGLDAGQFDFSGKPNLQETWLDLLHPDDRDRASQCFADYLAGGSIGMYESTFRLRHCDGRYVWIWSRGNTLRDLDGNPTDITIGTHIDITERKRAEAETTANHLRMLSIMDANVDGVYVSDPETYEVLYANRALAEVFGVPDQRRCYEYLQHRDSPCPFCTNGQLFGENFGKTVIWEFQNEVSGRWFRCLDRAITWPDGRVVRYEMATDLTERKQAEEALRESEERYRTLVEQASDGVVVTDAEGQCLSVNQAFADMLGFSVQELANRSFRDLVAEAEQLKADGASAESAPLREWSLERRDGSTVSVEANARILPDGRRMAIIRDVSGRKLAERMVGDEDMPYGAVITDAEFRFTRVSRVFCGMLGYAPEELIGKSVGEVTRPDDQDTTREHLGRLMRREIEHFVVEKRYITRSGGTVHALTFVRGFYAAGGGFLGTTASVVDISERVQAESALRESERRFSNVLESMSLIGVMLDTEGRITFCNDYLLNLTGWTRDEVLGQGWFERFLPSDRRDEIQNEVFLRNVMAGEVPVHFENEIVTRQDERRLVAWNNIILRDPAGQVTGTASVGEDITERRHVEESRLEMERRLLHSQKLESLGVLAGGIAHDFNNLLMAILGNLELGLRDLSPASPVRSRIDAAGHAARRAADLTRQMLAYSGRGKFMVGRVDLNALVEENVHLLRTSIPRTVTLNLHLDRVLPAVEADAGQLQQVIMNLITNASEAIGGEAGVITLSTGVRDCDDSYLSRSCLDERASAGSYVYLEVTDSGCGMDEETQKRMFEPFFTTKFTGRGLGLPAVFGIVRGHGGAILLDSAPGKGTTIRVLFPAAGVAPGAAVPAAAAPADEAEVAPGTGRGTILIVDDEEMVLQPCAAMVEYMGFTVLTAADGEEAVEMVRRHGATIRAIILDLTMPKLDGAGALERILRIEPGAQVILSSGYDEAEATGRVAKERLAGFIRKPYHLEQLRTTLERVLGTAL